MTRSRRLLALVAMSFVSACAAPAEDAEDVRAAGVEADDVRVLIFSKTAAFRHENIEHGAEVLLGLATSNGVTMDATEDAAEFTPESLERYDAVLFLSTTGDVLDEAQQEAFTAYIRSGGGYVGIHAASDTEYEWPWYGKLVGGYFDGHPGDPNVREGTVLVAEPAHPATSHLPNPWIRTDEWYDIRDLQGGVTVLLDVDETSYKRPDEDPTAEPRPIAWAREFDGGRMFYSALGHTSESFDEAAFLDHVWGGLSWVLGGAEGGATSQLIQPPEWWRVHPRPGYTGLEKVERYEDWFDVYRLTDGTYAIYEPNQFEEAVSYLILGSESGVLVDAGTGIANIRAVVEALTDLPVRILLTHEHYDHIGGAHLFDEILASENPVGLEVLAQGRDNASLQGYTGADYFWGGIPEWFDGRTWTIPGVVPTQTLAEGDILDLGGRALEVIYTPGHSPGSICLLDRENRLLLTGDHFFAGPLYGHAPDVDWDDYIASNRRLADMVDAYDRVLGGHNEPWVEAAVIPRVSDAFDAIFSGRGEYSEDDGLRRYRFDGFDVLVLVETIEERR